MSGWRLAPARGRILTMVIRQSAVQIAIGAIVGLGLAMLIATLGETSIQGVLFGVNPRDKAIYSLVLALIAIVSLIATLVPARRATRVDPIAALRAE